MEKFNQPTPIITERNQTETDMSAERMRDLLSNEIDITADTLKEFAIPDSETLSNETFQVFDKTYHRGSFDCSYENGELQGATIELTGRENQLDATLEYDQDRDAWLLHTIESDTPGLIQNLALMKSVVMQNTYSEFMKNAEPHEATFDDLVELFATRSKGFVDVKNYTSVSPDTDSFSLDNMGEVDTNLIVSTSLDPNKNYNSLHVLHRTTDFSSPDTPTSTVDREYRIDTGKNNVRYRENGMTQSEAGQYLAQLKDDKNFSSLAIEQL
ncbi:MAG: hypothetical protein L0H38_03510 [bacterium]|nr:hypothetical protein [bacterium]